MTPCSESYHLFQTRQILRYCNLNLFSMAYKTRGITFSKTFQDKTKILLIYRANMKISWKKIRKIKYLGKKAQMAQ